MTSPFPEFLLYFFSPSIDSPWPGIAEFGQRGRDHPAGRGYLVTCGATSHNAALIRYRYFAKRKCSPYPTPPHSTPPSPSHQCPEPLPRLSMEELHIPLVCCGRKILTVIHTTSPIIIGVSYLAIWIGNFFFSFSMTGSCLCCKTKYLRAQTPNVLVLNGVLGIEQGHCNYLLVDFNVI